MTSSANIAGEARSNPLEQDSRIFLRLRCPVCGRSSPSLVLDGTEMGERVCSFCGFVVKLTKGIWRCLAPSREEHFRAFLTEYAAVRALEGRGSSSARFYLALPFRDVTGRNAWQWKIRGRSFRFILRAVLPQLQSAYRRPMDVLDIGAGNGWMSFQFSVRGHRAVAVDILENDSDGLGAARHFFDRLPRPFFRFQAEMDRLPFEDGQFDLAVFNASFHYSEDYERTLRETLRCLRRPGHLLIMDSPFYPQEQNGLAMLQERHQDYEKHYGFRSDALQSRGFVTPQTLDRLASQLGLKWKISKPWYGIGWFLRPLKARLLGRRPPSRFFIFRAGVRES